MLHQRCNGVGRIHLGGLELNRNVSCSRIYGEYMESQSHPVLKFAEEIAESNETFKGHLWCMQRAHSSNTDQNIPSNNLESFILIYFPENYPASAPRVANTNKSDSHLTTDFWTPTEWNPDKQTGISIAIDYILQNNPSLELQHILDYLTQRPNWVPQFAWISIGCANDEDQTYPPRVKQVLNGLDAVNFKHGRPRMIDFLLIDPNFENPFGIFQHRKLSFQATQHEESITRSSLNVKLPTNDEQHIPVDRDIFDICVTVSSKPFEAIDVVSLESYVSWVLGNNGIVFIGDFAVGSPNGSISEFLKLKNPQLWLQQPNLKWAVPLAQISKQYNDGYSNIELCNFRLSEELTENVVTPIHLKDTHNCPSPRNRPIHSRSNDPLQAMLKIWLNPGTLSPVDLGNMRLEDFQLQEPLIKTTKFAAFDSTFTSSVIRNAVRPATHPH